MAQKAQAEQKEEYGFVDIDSDFNMIQSGIDAISCVQATIGYSPGACDCFSNGLYYMTTRLKEEVERLHNRVLEVVK